MSAPGGFRRGARRIAPASGRKVRMLAAVSAALLAAAAFALVGDDQASAAPFGNALVLDGNDDVATAPDSASLDLGLAADNDLTLEAFVYVPDTTTNSAETVIMKPQAYEFVILANAATQDIIRFTYWFPPNNHETVDAMVDLTTGWHHVAVVFVKGGSDQVRTYVDGVQVTSSNRSIGGMLDSNGALAIGNNGPFAEPGLRGVIDEVRISDVPRYTSNFTVPTAAFASDANTRGLWHFDEAACAISFADASTNGNTLTGANGAVSGLPSSDPVTLKFDANSYLAAEYDGVAMATVTRTGDPLPAVDVTYATSDDSPAPGSATAAADYSTVFGQVNFGCGDTSESFSVPIHTDSVIESNEVLDLTLSAPTAPASLGSPSAAVLTITDTTAQPDGLIKRSSDVGYLGDDVYDNGTAQLVKQKIKQGKSRIFDVRIENDGQPIDEFGLQGPGSNNKFKITYLQGAADVTDQVVAGDYFTAFLSTGGSHDLQVKVKVKNSANPGDTKTVSVVATSENNPDQTDAVRAKAKAK